MCVLVACVFLCVCVSFCCGFLSRCNLSFWRGKFCCSFAAFLCLYSVHSHVYATPPFTIVLLCSPGYGLNVLLFMRFSLSPPKNIFSWHAKSFCLNEVLILGEFLAKIGGKGRGCLFVGLRPALWSVARQLHENAFIIVANCCCFYVWTACAKAALKLQVFPLPLFSLFFLAISLFAFYFVYFQRPCHKFLVILLQIIYAHIEL